MGLNAVGGSKLYIGRRVVAKDVDLTLADFADATWTQIKGWSQAGEFGDTQEVVTQSFIDNNRTEMAKGPVTGGTSQNTFKPLPNDAGQQKFKAAIPSCSPYEFKIEWNAGCAPSGPVTISIGSPGVVTWAGGHGLEAGSAVKFATTGALPTGLVAGTTYYVLAAGLTADAFSVAATPGGTAIVTSGTQSGTHTATAQPAGTTNYFYGLALPGSLNGGAANAAQLRTWAIGINSNIVEV